MNILSNDPKDVIRRKITKTLGGQGQPRPSLAGPTKGKKPNVITTDDIPMDATNPVQHFNIGQFIVNGVLTFWTYVLKRFWLLIPAFAMGLYFFATPEDIAVIIESEITVGQLGLTAFNYFLLASMASLIPPFAIGAILKKAGSITHRTVMLLQLPAFGLAGLTFYSLSSIIFMFMKGLG